MQYLAFLLIIPAISGEVIKNLQTGSMPCYQNETYIETKKYLFSDIRVGDVICYYPELGPLRKYADISPLAANWLEYLKDGAYICHRIVYYDGEKAVTKADINAFADPFIVTRFEYRSSIDLESCAQ